MAEAMETGSWSSRRTSSARRYRSPTEKCSDELDEVEEDEQERRVEYTCPFCAEDFDVVGLYCHMDEEHPLAVKGGACPVCRKKVGQDLVAHITLQHSSLFKTQRKKRHRKGDHSSVFSRLRNELRDENSRSHYGGSSLTFSSLTEPDPLLSSFVFNPVVDAATGIELDSPCEESPFAEMCQQHSQRDAEKSPVPCKDHEEEDQKCEFVQGLIFSIVLDDGL